MMLAPLETTNGSQSGLRFLRTGNRWLTFGSYMSWKSDSHLTIVDVSLELRSPLAAVEPQCVLLTFQRGGFP